MEEIHAPKEENHEPAADDDAGAQIRLEIMSPMKRPAIRNAAPNLRESAIWVLFLAME